MTQVPLTQSNAPRISRNIAHQALPASYWGVRGTTAMRTLTLGLIIGLLGGGLLGLTVAHLGPTVLSPSIIHALILGAAGGGSLNGLFVGSLVAFSIFNRFDLRNGASTHDVSAG